LPDQCHHPQDCGSQRGLRPGPSRRADPAGAGNPVRPGQAACLYSWRMLPRRSRRRTSSRAIRAGSGAASGNGCWGQTRQPGDQGIVWEDKSVTAGRRTVLIQPDVNPPTPRPMIHRHLRRSCANLPHNAPVSRGSGVGSPGRGSNGFGAGPQSFCVESIPADLREG